MFGDTITREEVGGIKRGVFYGVVDKDEKTSTSSTPRAIAAHGRIPREISVGGGLGQFGFLNAGYLDALTD